MVPHTRKITPESKAVFDNLIKYAIAPRPICFASTVDSDGKVNLSPFSYFTMVSHQPPICVFAPVRRMRDGTTKHTYENILQVPEVVINIVNYAMVHQQSLASAEYDRGVDEFAKSGFTPVASELVAPPRVAESPVQLECRVRDVISLGDNPGGGSLVLAEVLLMHVQDGLLDGQGAIRLADLDLVARLGGNWYCRVTADSLFEVTKPQRSRGIGVDGLPEAIRYSPVLTGNHLGQLASVERLPTLDPKGAVHGDKTLQDLKAKFHGDKATLQLHLHRKAAGLLDQGLLNDAWQVLLLGL